MCHKNLKSTERTSFTDGSFQENTRTTKNKAGKKRKEEKKERKRERSNSMAFYASRAAPTPQL